MPDHDLMQLLPDDLRLVLAPNPSPMTWRGTNTWIVGRGAVAVIDPGPADDGHLAAILAALSPGERISHILVTHAHADHSALAPALASTSGAPVIAFGTARDGMRPVPAGFASADAGGEGVDAGFIPDIRLADGATVRGTGWQLEAIHTPGHLGNHLCLGWGECCFSGDHVMGWASSIVSPPEGHMGDYRTSLLRLAARPWAVLLPGHGDPVHDPATRLAALGAHRAGREAEILTLLADGPATIATLTAAIYARTPPMLHPAAARNVFAHLIDLADRNIVTATPALGFHAKFAAK